jgi:putative FmdB family regulatory protein
MYDYECTSKKCAHKFEKLLKMSDSDVDQSCPKCEKPAKKVMKAGHLMFRFNYFD